nr:hypothetical protein [Tanacetum cinerariifolium]
MYFVFWKQKIDSGSSPSAVLNNVARELGYLSLSDVADPEPEALSFDSDEASDDASNDGDEATTLDEPQPNPLDVASEAGPMRGSREKRKTVKFSPGGQKAKTQVVIEPGCGHGASTAST